MPEIHLIECEAQISGRRHTYFVDRDCDRLGLSNTIADIAGGQVTGVRKVYRADTELKSFHDVSAEIAQAIIDGMSDADDFPTGEVFEFCEDKLGCQFMAELSRELEAACPKNSTWRRMKI